jgi:hypothetical protein
LNEAGYSQVDWTWLEAVKQAQAEGMKPIQSRTPPAHVDDIVRELNALGKEDKNHLVRHTTLPVA